MRSDLPHTLYKPLDRRGKRSDPKNYRVNPSDPAFTRQQEAYERALARQKAKMEGKIPYRMEELYR
ncbi:MAG: hypothetical protein IJP77_06185 [Bacteroidales bacterium]|nr:hypothetical protein [Bacteroidales bacterium]